MIDTTEVLKMALMDDGQPATIGGQELANGVLFNHAPAQPDPYRSEGSGHDGPSVVLLQEDLTAVGEWPLVSTELTTDGISYRILRSDPYRGECTLYLRESA